MTNFGTRWDFTLEHVGIGPVALVAQVHLVPQSIVLNVLRRTWPKMSISVEAVAS